MQSHFFVSLQSSGVVAGFTVFLVGFTLPVSANKPKNYKPGALHGSIMVRMMSFFNPVLWCCVGLFLISGVSAFTLSGQTIDPSGSLHPGDPVTISVTAIAASGVAFPSYDDLQFVSELNDPLWSYSILVNGVENVRSPERGRTLTITGFELGYRNQDEVIVKATVQGTIPPSSILGATKTFLKIQEIDARGYAIPYSIVTIDHLIGEPTPVPTPAFGSVGVTSYPSGANVYLDNAYKGLTPLTLDAVPNGNHILIIRLDGYDDVSRTITVMGILQPVSVALTRGESSPPTVAATTKTTGSVTVRPGQTVVAPEPDSGSLSVTTSPLGAQVYIDGEMKGVTPTTIPGLSDGSHSVTLIMAGYSDMKTTIMIERGTTSEYISGLSPLPKTPGFELVPALLSLLGIVAIRKIRK